METSNEKVQVIKQINNFTLLKHTSECKIGHDTYYGTRYEIWTDADKMNQGIRGEDGSIYCMGLAGHSEKDAVRTFDNMIKEGE